MIKFILIGLLFLNISCAVAPSPQEMSSVEYGRPPLKVEELIKRYDSQTLKDPDSARYRGWTEPRKVWIKDFIESPFPSIYGGWAVCFERNAKNGYGGYNGFKSWAAVINYDALLIVRELSYFEKNNVFTSASFCDEN